MIVINSDNAIVKPYYATSRSAGFDIAANHAVVVRAGETVKIPTGLYITPINGIDSYELQIRSRSGLASQGLVVAQGVGTVDDDYEDEICVLIRNESKVDKHIARGDRIAQGVVCPVWRAVGVEVRDTKRNGGFGSSGL